MKKTVFGLAIILTVAIIGCGSSDSDSDSGGGNVNHDFATDYTPDLTESSGTEHYGDYYPFETGYGWRWTGSGDSSYKMTGNSGGEVMEDSDDMPTVPLCGTMNVLAPVDLTIEGADFTVYPLEESAFNDGDFFPVERRYFEKIDGTVYLRGIEGANGNIITVDDPVFIKSPLVVGDSWETHPNANFDTLLSDLVELDFEGCNSGTPSMDLDIKSVIYVVGNETKNNQETLRLDQRAHASGTMTIPNVGTLSINVNFSDKINLRENVGLVASNQTMEYTLSGNLSCNGNQATLNMTMNVDADVSLDAYEFDSPEQLNCSQSYAEYDIPTDNPLDNISRRSIKTTVRSDETLSDNLKMIPVEKIGDILMKIAGSVLIH